MRKVVKKYKAPPGELASTTLHNNRLLRIYNGNGALNTNKIYNSIYGARLVREELSKLYFDKCAYCETKDQEFEIEHYRPKRGVDGINHNGYYWLCYEWSNLLPACHDCNKKRSKSTKFPIEGTRVNSPVIINNEYKFKDHHFENRRLKREYPLLIHPEETNFDPNNYFKFDITGLMMPSAKKNSRRYRRAKTTIDDVVRLNRDKLYLNRRKDELRRYEKRLLGIFLIYFKNYRDYGKQVAITNLTSVFYDIMGEIKLRSCPDKEYSFFWNYVLNNFYEFLPEKLKNRPKDRTLFLNLIKAFN